MKTQTLNRKELTPKQYRNAAEAARRGDAMKTHEMMKKMTTILAVPVLVAALTVGQAAAEDLKIKGWNQPKTANQFGQIDPAMVKGGALTYNPQPAPTPAAQPAQPTVNNHYYEERGFGWGEFAGGTMLGIMAGSMANQPQQQTQPTVVYVQQPNADTPQRDQDLELEIERERAKARALELELEMLRAERDE
jgi:hypothetical protein